MSRNTVAHYQRWATEHGVLTGPLPEPAALAALLAAPHDQRPALAPRALWRERVVAYGRVEPASTPPRAAGPDEPERRPPRAAGPGPP